MHEKVDTMKCGNNRAVTFRGITYKILANILYVKLVPYAEEIIGEYQGCFQRGRSTGDQIFTTIWKNVGNRIQMYIIYLLIFRQHMTLY